MVYEELKVRIYDEYLTHFKKEQELFERGMRNDPNLRIWTPVSLSMSNAISEERLLEQVSNGVCFSKIVFLTLPKKVWREYPRERPLAELANDAEGCAKQIQNAVDIQRQTELYNYRFYWCSPTFLPFFRGAGFFFRIFI